MSTRDWFITFLPLLTLCGLAPTISAAASDDPYAPLQLYQGKWAVTVGGKTSELENHCARTGLFFACEQVVDGKPMALVVFLPRGRSDAGQTYRTQALTADAVAPGPWSRLTIKRDDWTYLDPSEPPRQRTLNHFTGRDHIHFDVQTSPNGKAWTTQMSGDEQRAP